VKQACPFCKRPPRLCSSSTPTSTSPRTSIHTAPEEPASTPLFFDLLSPCDSLLPTPRHFLVTTCHLERLPRRRAGHTRPSITDQKWSNPQPRARPASVPERMKLNPRDKSVKKLQNANAGNVSGTASTASPPSPTTPTQTLAHPRPPWPVSWPFHPTITPITTCCITPTTHTRHPPSRPPSKS